jgi:uncharacterized protein (TIGR04168 family)
VVSPSLRIAVIGDVHDLWQPEVDCAMLHSLKVDLVLFVGDFGNEVVPLVKAIADLDLPKAIILGNHDAWYSASEWGKKKCPYDRSLEDRVQQQLDDLGIAHVGYGRRDFPELELSVVGGRPFTWGGQVWKSADFYRDRYGITDFQASTDRISQAAKSSPYQTIIFLGHNGPFGLGDRPQDICGKDWESKSGDKGGDYGDPDFAEAIAQTKLTDKQVPLVAFGHMHHQLRCGTKLRQSLREVDNTIYLNAASVPRIFQQGDRELHNFSLVELQHGQVIQASLVWLDLDHQIQSQTILYGAS